ncbi:EamA-like transporter family protein [Serratia fonticola]|jgi:drug/metabolite transporter (DMT)-like permease|uniref:EamA-like transporter family protein n=1 Tax=Serratia fonticola TaxID=47917 RepID=A0A542CY94_SERFO|nr:DMT family transporter [Serratia fonticola]TQI82189.1 EamA-like transporter family protein [Serratia fonticola]TQI95789.1 EamA-like transporter family protein [Serratia fonticola]TVZ70285.1 EamA-like transporter family protein [Serratia fonticola]
MELTIERKGQYISGVFFVLSFVFLASAKEVYIGHAVQGIPPYLLVIYCFVPISILFFLIYLWKSGFDDFILETKKNIKDVVAVNISTSVSWIASFYALKYIEPSIENAINTGIGPVITFIAAFSINNISHYNKREVISSIGISFAIIIMIAISLSGKSGVENHSHIDTVYGVLFCFLTGLGIVGNTIFSKRLSKSGCSTSFVLTTRFYLMLIVSFFMLFYTTTNIEPLHLLKENLAGVIVLTFFGIMLPLFLLQKGIERIEPMTISLLIVLGPILTYTLQFFDDRLSLSYYTLMAILFVVGFVVYGISSQKRS